MRSLIKEVFYYLRYPWLTAIGPSSHPSFLVFFRLTLICVLTGIIAGSFSGILVRHNLIPDPGPSLLDNREVSQFQFFIAAVFIAPILEESIFRAQLRRFSAGLMFIAFVCGILLSAFTKTYWAFLISPFLFGILFIIYRFTIAGSISRKFNFWNRLFPWHFHFTALCFALVHLGNFEKGISLLPWGILYTLPQLAIGFLLGYTRMVHGLKYSIALHSLYNLCFVILLFSKH